jgi:CDP-diacylglycerol--serine O-phosphatidyltransferase
MAVFCGFNAMLFGNFSLPLYFILAAAVFDFFDGFAARMLKAYSEIGKQLDSLADMVSFGLAPSAVAAAILGSSSDINNMLPLAGFAIAVFSALRLAKFNIDNRQETSFIGLAVPANAIFWAGLANSYNAQIIDFPYIIIVLITISCFMLVCNLPMFSLKFKTYKWKGNEFRWILIFGAIILLILIQLRAFAWIIIFYIFLSFIKYFCCKNS